MFAVMGDVFASVYNFHSPLSSKVKLSIQRSCKLRFLISRCWSVGYFFNFVVLRLLRVLFLFVCMCSPSPCCGVSRLLVELLRVLVSLPEDGRTTDTCSSIIQGVQSSRKPASSVEHKSVDNKHTLFNSELHFSVTVHRLATAVNKDWLLMPLTAVTRSDQLTTRVYQRHDSLRYRHLQP
jgi:hypothetical protein